MRVHRPKPAIPVREVEGEVTCGKPECAPQKVVQFLVLEYDMCRVGQNRIYTPYMTVCVVISLLKLPHVHRKYL